MKFLVTGSSGHLGEGLVRKLKEQGHSVSGLDRRSSFYTTFVGSILDKDLVCEALSGIEIVIHSATLHKPHIPKYSAQNFIDTNLSGTLMLLECAHEAGVRGFIYTSTTSAYGASLKPADPHKANWIDEHLMTEPKDIYGTTKRAAEDLCHWFYKIRELPCIVLRVARFFPEPDSDPTRLAQYDDLNIKTNEFLYRRVDLEDAVDAHLLAAQLVADIGFGRYIISATIPFDKSHIEPLREDAQAVVRSLFPDYEEVYGERGWKIPPSIDRLYINTLARKELGWQPRTNFREVLDRLRANKPIYSELALIVGCKDY